MRTHFCNPVENNLNPQCLEINYPTTREGVSIFYFTRVRHPPKFIHSLNDIIVNKLEQCRDNTYEHQWKMDVPTALTEGKIW